MSYLRLEKDNEIAIVWLDQEGEKVNKLGSYLVDEFNNLLDTLQADSDVKAVILISGKRDTFIAGADLDNLLSLSTPDAVEKLSRQGQTIMNRMENFPKPIIAAIHGAALGGGLEVALACHYRIASDSPKTILGLPEVKLGLLPGSGGTQRLPRLIDLQQALDMMLSGKNIYPRQAKRLGLVDELIHEYGLLHASKMAARQIIKQGRKKRKKKNSIFNKLLENIPFTRNFIFSKAQEMVLKRTYGNYPAPLKIIEVVKIGLEKGKKLGFTAEAKAFAELSQTPVAKELIRIFFNMTDLKKNPLKAQAKPVQKIGILGAGFMGAGIAQISIEKNYKVLMKDLSLEAVARGEKSIYDALQAKVKRKIITEFERDRLFSHLAGITDYRQLKTADLVIEAVFEDLSIKQNVLAETEAVVSEKCVFASNTSSLPISQIAEKARHPERVLGMHYFSPVPKMPLLEIIVTDKTAEWATATAIDVGIKQGKTVIVVNDGPGFYTTRILSPMLNEALLLLEEGGEIEHIDRTMRKYGFPVGPIALIDEVGIDVGAHVSEVLGPMFAKRGVQPTDVMKRMSEAGFKGRKNQKGFYHYHSNINFIEKMMGKKKKEVNTAVYQFFGGQKRKKHDSAEIQMRLTMVMVNEAARCLEEGILQSPRDGDVGAIFGLGFPPFLGGPFRYLDRLGPQEALKTLEMLEKAHGVRFQPANIIREHAQNNRTFYAD